jgi:PKD repeat protein
MLSLNNSASPNTPLKFISSEFTGCLTSKPKTSCRTSFLPLPLLTTVILSFALAACTPKSVTVPVTPPAPSISTIPHPRQSSTEILTVGVTILGNGSTFQFISTVTSNLNSLTLTSWTWNYGDGVSCTGTPTTNPACSVNVTHTYTLPGSYTVSFIVTDSIGTKGSVSGTFISPYVTDKVTATIAATPNPAYLPKIGTGVLVTINISAASSSGVLVSLAKNCGAGVTPSIENLYNAPSVPGKIIINGVKNFTTAFSCYYFTAGKSTATFTVTDSINKSATASTVVTIVKP